jgi:hypothetical protein
MTRRELAVRSIRASPVLSFLRSSESLRKIVLHGNDGDDQVIRCFFKSIAENPSIEDLSVDSDFHFSPL